MTPREAWERLQQVASGPEPWPLAEAALLLAVDAYPDLDPAPYLEYLRTLADRVTFDPQSIPSIGGLTGRHLCLGKLVRVLFGEEAFAGNAVEYYDPRNSFLNEVIDRRRGIPITLAVVALGVARFGGMPLAGVNFPGHFLVRWDDPVQTLHLDLFERGRCLSEEDLRARWAVATNGAPWDDSALKPATDRQILLRMLNNLKMIYAQTRQYQEAIAVVEKMLLLDPLTAEHHRALGYLCANSHALGTAIECLERYLALAPDAPDAEEVRQHLRAVGGAIARWN